MSDSTHQVYFARDILSGEDVVVKLEPVEGKAHTLNHEFQVYAMLNRGVGIPRAHWFGTEAGFNAMVTERLGPSLADLFVQYHFQFTLQTVLLLAGQLLRHLQYIHSRNFIHRDLKPSNIVTGVGKHANLVYIIDFGLSKQFRDPNTRRHIPYNTSRGFTGTADFASVNSHRGSELGRRDDLESLAYILIYFVHGSLPWQGMGQNIHAVKQGITSHHMFKELPAEFLIFLQHCRSLAFDDKPNYDYYLNLFNNLLPEGLQSNPTFDWISSDE